MIKPSEGCALFNLGERLVFMDIRDMLHQVKSGEMDMDTAEKLLKDLPYEELGYAKLDHHRKLRSGFGETVFCQGKPDSYLVEIYKRLYERDGEVFGTRATKEQYELIKPAIPQITYDPISRILKADKPGKEKKGWVSVCTGGTSDIPVAEEAAQTAEYFGCYVDRIFDVGVAGIHRLLSQRERLTKANCIIAAAGMEGALGTVIAGLAECPVIAVPTSVGYGASFHGLSALLTMLNSCANGISVVNIDNGYGAGYIATQINRIAEK
jgi:NCAIR mutase (PurE)-related protein